VELDFRDDTVTVGISEVAGALATITSPNLGLDDREIVARGIARPLECARSNVPFSA
jgi:hypothetical protein